MESSDLFGKAEHVAGQGLGDSYKQTNSLNSHGRNMLLGSASN